MMKYNLVSNMIFDKIADRHQNPLWLSHVRAGLYVANTRYIDNIITET
jgi:hypothetical protein